MFDVCDLYDVDRFSVESFTNTVQFTSGLLVPYNDRRVSLVIPCPQTNRFTLAWGEAAVLDQGITLYPAGSPLVLSLRLHGSLVWGPIFAIGAVVPQTVRVYGSVCHVCQASQKSGYSLRSR